ncbi:MAG: alpha/beta hydrolase [Terriglobia bacterium]|nr:alpha/beta hydrolase [Terriglobia bacterium]
MTRRLFCISAFLLFAISTFPQTTKSQRAVDLTSADGTKLKATFFAAAKPGPGVLLLHQCNRDRKVWDPLPEQLAAAGINVLTFDLRNFGESEGKPFAQLTQQEKQASAQKWPADVDAAFEYVVSQPGVKRGDIGLAGASCGVDNSIKAAMRHPEVKSMVLLAGPTNLAGRDFLRKSNMPVLYGYADDDQFPETIVETEWLYELTPNEGKRLVRYPNGGHGAEIFPVHPEFVGVIRDWFVTTLLKTPGQAPVPKEKPAISKQAKVLSLLDEPGGVAKVSAMLAEARKSDPKATIFPEASVNLMGYEHLQANDTKAAVEILKLNAEAYPNSTNVYDSLSDAYLADGQNELALVNVKKALEMLKTDTTTPQQLRDGIKQSCEQKLKQLEKTD